MKPDAKVKNWEVGSNWFLNPSSASNDECSPVPSCPSMDKVALLSTCRSAIGLCLKDIGRLKVALVPSFTCHSVIAPFAKLGMKVIGYPVKKDLSIDWDGVAALVDEHSPDVMLIHGYFGFDTTQNWHSPISELMKRGTAVIEDMTQTMFSCYEHIASDYKVGSIRKWMPIPDGAFLANLDAGCLDEDIELSKAKLDALMSKGEYIYYGTGSKACFMQKFADAENLLDSRSIPRSMSRISYSLMSNTDIAELKRARRDNYNCLASRLREHAELKVIRPELKGDEVPFLLPVYVEKRRSEFQTFMAKHNVYPTVIWRCPDELEHNIDSVSAYIYDSILCFHIDQRYNVGDMKIVGDIVDSYFSLNKSYE